MDNYIYEDDQLWVLLAYSTSFRDVEALLHNGEELIIDEDSCLDTPYKQSILALSEKTNLFTISLHEKCAARLLLNSCNIDHIDFKTLKYFGIYDNILWDRLDRILNMEKPYCDYVSVVAARMGRLDVLKKMNSFDIEQAACAAIIGEHVDVFEWLNVKTYHISHAMKQAACYTKNPYFNKKLNCKGKHMSFATRQNRISGYSEYCSVASAAWIGNIELLQYILVGPALCEWKNILNYASPEEISQAWKFAVGGGQLKVLKWLKFHDKLFINMDYSRSDARSLLEMCYQCDDMFDLLYLSIITANKKIFRWLAKHIVYDDEQSLRMDWQGKNIKIFRYLSSSHLEFIDDNKSQMMLEFLHANYGLDVSYVFLNAIKRNNFRRVKRLYNDKLLHLVAYGEAAIKNQNKEIVQFLREKNLICADMYEKFCKSNNMPILPGMPQHFIWR